jgi:molecular chaperone DnaK
VAAQDKATGKEQSIRITASSGLSDDEIDQMMADAEANAEADAKFEETVTARNTCEGLMHATRKTLEEAGDKASEEEKTAIEAAIAEAEEAIKGDDKDAMDAATTKLTEASGELAQKLYAEQAAQAEAAGAGAGADAGGHAEPADDVVDAEFEEVKDDDKKAG